MAYDEQLAERIRTLVADADGVSEKRMFGGLAFLINGNMAVCAASAGGLMVRVDPAETDDLIDPPGVDRFEMRGRKLDGWLFVRAGSVASEDALAVWVDRGSSYARSLPAK